MSDEKSKLKPIGTIFYEYYSSGTRANRFSHDAVNDVRRLKVTLEVVDHIVNAAGKKCCLVKEIKSEYID